MVKNPPAKQETQVPSLGQEYPPEKGMATHPSILVWEIPWPEEPEGLQSLGLKGLDTTERLIHIFVILLSWPISICLRRVTEGIKTPRNFFDI